MSHGAQLHRRVANIVSAGDRYRVPQEELIGGLLPGGPDAAAKQSAFWVLLVASAFIASAGVLTDSTAVVIGAMVIAPLGTPIFGVGAALITARPVWPVARRLVLAMLTVVAIGAIAQLTSLDRVEPLENPQILSRAEPALIDMAVAFATGFVGAMALSRTDIAPALSGVAIAISLVPPLAVVGVALSEGLPLVAFGALTLFLTNMVAIILAAMLVFGATGVGAEWRSHNVRARRIVWALSGAIVVILVGSSVGVAVVSVDQQRIGSAARAWADGTGAWQLTSTQRAGDRIVVRFVGEGDPPRLDGSDLARALTDASITHREIDVRFERGGTITP